MKKTIKFIALPAVIIVAAAAALFAFVFDKPVSYMNGVKSVSITVKHEAYKNFSESHTLKPGEQAYIHDTNYTFVITDFMPDFRIKRQTGEAYSRTDAPENPAVKIELYVENEKLDEAWYILKKKDYYKVFKPGIYFVIDNIVYGDVKYE